MKLKWILPLIMSIGSTCVEASYQHIYFNSISNLGNAYAGEAATAYDATTAYLNPAGLTHLDRQFVAGVAVARFSAHFRGTNTMFLPPHPPNRVPTIYSVSGSTTATPTYIPFPTLAYTQPVSERMHVGVSLSAIGGVGASFSKRSVARYNMQHNQVGILDFTPNLAYQINDMVSAGAGLDVGYMILKAGVMTPPYFGHDAENKFQARGVGYGWHAGILAQLAPCTRVGFVYHSRISFHPSGQSQFIFNPGQTPRAELTTTNFRTLQRYAAFWALSAYHEFNNKWAVMGTFGLDYWSGFHHTYLRNVAQPSRTGQPTAVTIPVPFHVEDTFRVGVGVNYAVNPCLLFRAGFTYESNPTSDRTRLLETGPIKQAYNLGIGAHYQMLPCVSFDFAASHIIFRRASLEATAGPVFQNSHITPTRDVVGAQLNWDIV